MQNIKVNGYKIYLEVRSNSNKLPTHKLTNEQTPHQVRI